MSGWAPVAVGGGSGLGNFDRIAPHYAFLERCVFGFDLERARSAFLPAPSIREGGKALLLGDGDGRFSVALALAHPGSVIEVVEPSQVMRDLAQRRWAEAGVLPRAIHHRGDIEEFLGASQGGGYDLVVTQFFLDCFEEKELARLVPALAALVRPGGEWWFGDFQIPGKGGWKDWRASFLLAVMYRCFGMVSDLETQRLVDPRPFLRDDGWECVEQRTWNADFVVAERWQNRAAAIGSSLVEECSW
ncbi:MAG: class I SAM-dependent methyltransferase [Verrucomicrobiota bacterium]